MSAMHQLRSKLAKVASVSSHRFLVLAASLITVANASAVTIPLSDATITSGASTDVVASLPAGAEFIRVTGDWAVASGSPDSDELELTILGPNGITGFLPVFANAESDSSPVTDLYGIAELTSAGVLGNYTLSFTNGASGTGMSLSAVSIDLLTLQEGFTDSGLISSGSPTFDRPNENGSASGRTTRYSAYTFTPTHSGTYIIDSQQAGFDGFIALYSGSYAAAPFSNFVAANDDSSAGESFSRLEVALTSGQAYTLVTTSFSSIASGSFTNRIRIFEALNAKATTFEEFASDRGFVGGPDDDDNGNGLSNLLEYGLGRDESSSLEPPLTIRLVNGRLVGRFYRDDELTDITYILEASDDLGSWQEIYNSSTDGSANIDGDFQEIEDVKLLSGQRFFRLRIELNTPTFESYATERGFVGGPEADDNGNGLSNLLEYALGREENSPADPPVALSLQNGKLVGRFYRDPELSDITYILEASDNLVTWDPIYDSSVNMIENADGDFQVIEDVKALSGQRFFRLRVVLAD